MSAIASVFFSSCDCTFQMPFFFDILRIFFFIIMIFFGNGDKVILFGFL